MKKITLLFVVALFTFSCTNEPMALNTESQAVTNSALSAKAGSTTKAPSTASTSNWGDYNIAVTVSPDGSEWTYLITKTKANAKTLSHLIISLNNGGCPGENATLADVVWATVNGEYTNLSNTEGNGTSCEPITNNFIKFPTFSAATSWILVIKFDRGYEEFKIAEAWIKAGTSCNSGTIPAPGCPKKEYCSYSQGYFFSEGADNNGSSALWGSGVTIGGVNYSQEQGMYFWSIDKGQGGDQTMNAFFQLGAVRLSGVESQVAADVAIIDAYFNGINVSSEIATGSKGPNTYQYFTLPANVTTTNAVITKEMVIKAGGRIGAYIDAHHCL